MPHVNRQLKTQPNIVALAISARHGDHSRDIPEPPHLRFGKFWKTLSRVAYLPRR
jgi:hypothetical protein